MFINVVASGTNVQRLAKTAGKNVDGVVCTAYSQLEKTEDNIVKRQFFRTNIATLRDEVQKLDATVMPSWSKIWAEPEANRVFIENLFQCLTGRNSLRRELNLEFMAKERVSCFMVFVSANKAPMNRLQSIIENALDDEWAVMILNGDKTSNRESEWNTRVVIAEAKRANKKGVIIISNQMGSRSYSVSEIQATVMAYDSGSVDASLQKSSRMATPGMTYHGTNKPVGMIVDLSFDPNRNENIERLIIEEAAMLTRADEEDADDFVKAVRFFLSSVDVFKMGAYGQIEKVDEAQMFEILGDNETLLKIADVTYDIEAAISSGVFDILAKVAVGKKSKDRKEAANDGVKNQIIQGGTDKEPKLTDKEKRAAEKIIAEAISKINGSATTIYYLANGGDTFREVLVLISNNSAFNVEFEEFYGITAEEAIRVLDEGALDELILDTIVQNSQPKESDSIF